VLSFDDLYEQLITKDEVPTIEAKTASDIGTKILQTICSFANEPIGGGYILLGVAGKKVQGGLTIYDIVGVGDPDRLQNELANQCANCFNTLIRPQCKSTCIRMANG